MPARVSFVFVQQLPGRKVKRRCVSPTKRNRHKPACTRSALRGVLSFKAHPGVNTVSFQRRISRKKKLPPGSYALTITAASGSLLAKPASLRFKIVT